MTTQDLQELLELEKKFYAKLNETMNLSHDLADAIDRQDQVSVSMLLSMRQHPILELQEINSYISLKRIDLTAEDAQRFDELIGGANAASASEQPVASQIATNRRLLERLTELDCRINKKICGEQSVYNRP